MSQVWSLRDNKSQQDFIQSALNFPEKQALDSSNKSPISVNLPKMLKQMLTTRGLTSENSLDTFFSPKLSSLRDPFSIINMEKVVNRLIKTFENKEKICIYGDFDLDGASGVALLKRGLESFGFSDISYYQPSRLHEGYGVHAEAVEKIAKGGVTVILTVDVGVTAFLAAEKAKELGVSLLITDHHLAKDELPVAEAIVNPNLTECTSGLGHLCGVGVGFFVLLALKKRMSEEFNGKKLLTKKIDMKSLLDLFIIGTLTDMVPLIDENRVLVKHGLNQLEKTKRPGLKYLLKALSLDKCKLTSQDVAIRFAPKLNALSRMDDGLLPVDIFLVEDDAKAKELIKSVLLCNEKRIKSQKNAEEVALELHQKNESSLTDELTDKLADKLPGEMAVKQNGFIWVWSDQMHKGVIGLVATKFSQKFLVPTFVGSVKGDKIIGSSRRPFEGEPNLLDMLGSCSEALTQFGGHASAAGFELPLEKAKEFEEKLQSFFDSLAEESNSVIDDGVKNNSLPSFYEAEGYFADLSPQFMKWYGGLEPFGMSFESPSFLFKDVQVLKKKTLRGGHLKLDLRQLTPMGNVQALWFSPPGDHVFYEVADEDFAHNAIVVDVLASPQWNYFAGRKTLQLVVSDVRKKIGG